MIIRKLMAIFAAAILLMVVGCETSSEDAETAPTETADVVETSGEDSAVESDAVEEEGDASEEAADEEVSESEASDSSEEDDAGEAAEAFQQGLGDGLGVAPGQGHEQHQLEQFVVGQGFGSGVEKALAQAVAVADMVGLIGHRDAQL